MGQSWSIIIFSYNEAGNIERFVPQVQQFCKEYLLDRSYEIIIVDDGSTDGSEEYIASLQQSEKIKIIKHSTNKGIGNAIKSGYKKAQFDNICALPADGQFNVNELIPYLSFPADNYIAFYRPHKKGYNWFRSFLNDFNNHLNRWFLGLNLKDVNWIKVYKHEQLNKITLRLKSSLIESEICTKLNHLKYQSIEVPSKYLTRQHGKSKGGSYKTVSKAAFEIILLLIETIKFRYKS